MASTNKRKKFAFRRYIVWLLIPIPAILGMIGFYMEGVDFWNAAYSCLTMYLIDFEGPTFNAWIQAARWLAPLATASGLSVIFASIGRFLKRVYASCSKKSVAVFGPEAEKQELLRELGIHGISMDADAVRAGSYILIGTEEENLEFYKQNEEILKGKDVYLKCSSLPEQASNDPRLHLFSPEEAAARIFWKDHCPYAISKENNHHIRIAMFGFGRIGKELILQGLQYNIFAPDQRIEYHIFGDDAGFIDTHPQLPEISDPVVVHDEPWYKAKDLLQTCQMLIVVQQEKQLDLLQELILLYPRREIHVFEAQSSGIKLLERSGNIVGFDWLAASMELESIRGIRVHYLAKKLNLRYAHLYTGVEENDKNLEAEWMKLNTFTRYSNISSANYHDVRMHVLEGEPMTEERLRYLGELEHIRWCRYHYLNNWQYGVPENGKAKDPEKRIHMLLVPNDQLDEAEQEKDRENVRMLIALQEEL